jgi:hypothetical protein
MLIGTNTGGLQDWNVVKTLGKTNAKVKTSNFTFSSKARNCPSASNAGVA